jgi:hypothetical protein
MVVTGHPPTTIRIRGGASAFFLLNKTLCDVRNTGIARQLRVHLPGVRGWLHLRLTQYPIDFCRAPVFFTTVAVSPLVTKLAQATAPLP